MQSEKKHEPVIFDDIHIPFYLLHIFDVIHIIPLLMYELNRVFPAEFNQTFSNSNLQTLRSEPSQPAGRSAATYTHRAQLDLAFTGKTPPVLCTTHGHIICAYIQYAYVCIMQYAL